MSRQVFDVFLTAQGAPATGLLLPVEALAARVGALSLEAMLSDPANWSSCIAKAGRLLSLDALMLGFNAEAQDQTEIGLEALNRLTQTERAQYACVACLPGPSAVAQSGQDEAGVKEQMVARAEAICKVRPDLLLFREAGALGKEPISMGQRKLFNTLKNMASYYNVPVGLYLEDYDSARLPDLGLLKLNFVLLGADQNGQVPDLDALAALADAVQGIGVPLPFDDEANALALASRYQEKLAGRNTLYTALNEFERDADLEGLRNLINRIQQ